MNCDQEQRTKCSVFYNIAFLINGIPIIITSWDQLCQILNRDEHLIVYKAISKEVDKKCFKPSEQNVYFDPIDDDGFGTDHFDYFLYYFGNFKKVWIDAVNDRIIREPDVLVMCNEKMSISLHFRYASCFETETVDGR